MLKQWLQRRLPRLANTYRRVQLVVRTKIERWSRTPRERSDEFHVHQHVNYESVCERDRHGRVLTLVAQNRGDPGWGDVLELGCADGVFTRDLAARCASVTAYDLSPFACARARVRLQDCGNIRIEQGDLEAFSAAARYDVIFVMDVLELIEDSRKLMRIANSLAKAVRPGGLIVISDCRAPELVRDTIWRHFVEDGERVVQVLANSGRLQLLRSEFHPPSGRDVPPDYYAHVIALFAPIHP